MTQAEEHEKQIGHGTSLEESIARFVESFEIEQPDPILNMKKLTEDDGFTTDYWQNKHRRFGELRDEYLAWEQASGIAKAQAVHDQQPPTRGKSAFVAAGTTLFEAIRAGLTVLKSAK